MFSFDSVVATVLGAVACLVAAGAGLSLIGLLADVTHGTVSVNDIDREHYRAWKLALASRVRYIDPRTLPDKDRGLVERAQNSVDTVLHSEAHRTRAIDRIRNQVELPDQLWRIAKDLVDLQPHQQDLDNARVAVTSNDGRAALGRRREQLATAHKAIEERVAKLDRYAARVIEVDRRLAEVRALEQLGTEGGAQDVVARITATDADAKYLDTLDTDAVQALKASVEAAREAAMWI
ncbi:hypothetical protein BIV57_18140 [Mangrovactinospora gilvigrisea]|uniref:Uncharacterized protein n=1 Tax=Mangrovactinospora gilvigrisea TaxID=1428644 RepID=A0A1J7C3F9_9ACTN|nr:hypothetical protein [Mangrovactinospora gilvigrisea]OIV36080.1 hypothetical protein BIV57_18140 [Mangrovactinospora gilvigrisea]